MELIERPAFITFTEDPPTRTYHYGVKGTIVPTSAKNLVAAAAPPVIATPQGLLYRQPIDANQIHYNQWDVDVSYAQRNKEPGTWSWDSDSTGATVQVFVSKETIRRYSAASNQAGSDAEVLGGAPDYKGAIAVDRDGNVQGTPIVIPSMRVNVQMKYPPGVVTLQHAYFIENLTGMVNSAPFLGRQAGEVLFMGGRLQAGEDTESTAHFAFAMSKNATLTFGSIANVVKLGWHFAWQIFSYEVGTTEVESRRPKYVYVERVYDTADLAQQLGFG